MQHSRPLTVLLLNLFLGIIAPIKIIKGLLVNTKNANTFTETRKGQY